MSRFNQERSALKRRVTALEQASPQGLPGTPVAMGSPSEGAALALWRAFTKKGFRAWCYKFGLAGSVTHTVTIVEAGRRSCKSTTRSST